MSQHLFQSKAELERWIKSFASSLERPCVVLLEGHLGAGKTQCVRWMCEALGALEVASPTFAVHHQYSAVGGEMDHVDLYRVKDDAELENSGFWDLLAKPKALLFVEWADRLPLEVFPESWTRVSLNLKKVGQDEARELSGVLGGLRPSVVNDVQKFLDGFLREGQ